MCILALAVIFFFGLVGCTNPTENTPRESEQHFATESETTTEHSSSADSQRPYQSAVDTLAYTDGLSVVFTKLPSPPTRKKITNPTEVKEICDFITSNVGEQIKVYTENESRPAGWFIFLNFSNGTMLSNNGGNKIEINNTVYRVEDDFIDKLISFYYSAEEPEE